MTVKKSRGQKAAKKLGREHMAKIGAKGGAKTPGTFASKRGLAKRAGIRSGMARKLKAMDKKIEEIDNQIQSDARFSSEHLPDDIKELILVRDKLVLDRAMLEADYNGKAIISMQDDDTIPAVLEYIDYNQDGTVNE